MFWRIQLVLSAILVAIAPLVAQSNSKSLPASLLIARDSYIDIGPPFNFYEVFTVNEVANQLVLERALISPAGDACFQPPSVEIQTAKLNANMAALLKNRNPCDIPEKVLRQESKRCKHCLNFAGSNVVMHVSCNGHDRQIRMNILEKDWFDKAPGTPKNTSWGISVMQELDASLGSGVMDKPVFTASDASKAPGKESLDSPIAKALQEAKYDYLFDSKQSVSEMFRESLQPLRTPIVELVTPPATTPKSQKLPKYPPIARAAHVSGKVTATFSVAPTGRAEDINVTSGPDMLRKSVRDALAEWAFLESTASHTEQAIFNFNLNCNQFLINASSPAQN